MASRLELVLRAGQAAQTGPSGAAGDGPAGRLADFSPGGRRNDPSSPGMQGALEVAYRAEARNAELREANARALRAEQREAHERVQREAAAREIMKHYEARDRQKEQKLRAYAAGQSNIRWAIREAQAPAVGAMQNRIERLLNRAHNRDGAEAVQDQRDLEELISQLTMLKSAVDAPGDAFYD